MVEDGQTKGDTNNKHRRVLVFHKPYEKGVGTGQYLFWGPFKNWKQKRQNKMRNPNKEQAVVNYQRKYFGPHATKFVGVL